MTGKARAGPRPAPMREAELAARWAAGAWRGATLRALSGAIYRLIFEGRRNGGPGPDFRDAALQTENGARLLGDIELHLRARDWLAHGHHTDRRYNRVVLHIALDTSSSSSPLASGEDVPVVCLNFSQTAIQAPPDWPCAHLQARGGAVALRALLLWAESERFERHVRAFTDDLSRASPAHDTSDSGWTAPDRVLWLALAEALGYGQHREALRQAGIGLLIGEPLGLDSAHSGERIRLGGLLALWDRWRVTGPWEALRVALMAGSAAVVAALRVPGGAISASRARIMAANVVFPFAVALAARMGEASLAERARAAYLESPGLPSNQITREMALHLGLTSPLPERRRSRDCIMSGPTGVTRRTVRAAPAIRAGLLRKPYRQSLADTV
jgi:hypothetical protein